NTGFVIEPRAILTNEWYTDPLTMHLLRHCRLRANFENTKWRGIEIKRGQFVTSLKTLSTETGMSVKQVRTALEKLEKTGYAASKATNKNRIITVFFYDEEQSMGKQTGKQTGKQRANKRAGKGQTEGKQRATDNNNISNDILNNEKQGVCAPSAHTQQENNAAAPGAPLAERGHAAVTWNEIRQFQIDHHIGSGEIVDDFYDAFKKSGTRIPDNWQDLYCRFAKASYDVQLEFAKNLKAGKYYDRWGKADE
ncbi:MAG: hypothetical protein IIZ23_07120, partial [Ruminococcus sp.]|nr:hypothetical protein [Ruminococcus sp.]